MRFTVLVTLVLLSSCDCGSPVPGQLRPLFEEIILPPSLGECTAPTQVADCGEGNPCTRTNPQNRAFLLCENPTPQLMQAFSVTNIGETQVTIESASFVPSDRGGGVESFETPVLDKTDLFAGDQASIAFRYFTEDIFTAAFADLVITSNASNPTLIVPTSTVPFPQGEGEGEGEGE